MNGKNKEKIEEKEGKKVCPFSKDLSCENCRLYQTYLGGGGKRICIFTRMNDAKFV